MKQKNFAQKAKFFYKNNKIAQKATFCTETKSLSEKLILQKILICIFMNLQ